MAHPFLQGLLIGLSSKKPILWLNFLLGNYLVFCNVFRICCSFILESQKILYKVVKPVQLLEIQQIFALKRVFYTALNGHTEKNLSNEIEGTFKFVCYRVCFAVRRTTGGREILKMKFAKCYECIHFLKGL